MARYDLQTVKQACVIEDVVGDYVSLSRKGKLLVGICPFHNDSTPSLRVDPDRQTWACYVCNIWGDAIDFVEKYNDCSKHEAINELADKYGLIGEKVNLKKLEKSKLRREKIKKFRANIDRRLGIIEHYVWDKHNEIDNKGDISEEDWEWLSKTEMYRTLGFDIRTKFQACDNTEIESAYDGDSYPSWLRLAHSPIFNNAVTYTKTKAIQSFATGLPNHAKLMFQLARATGETDPAKIAAKCFENKQTIYKREYGRLIKRAEERMNEPDKDSSLRKEKSIPVS